MADRDYKAFIVEGEAREPLIIDNISKVFFGHGNFKIITLPAGQNIYMLWKRLKEDDFDTDIIEVIREEHKELEKQLAGLSRDDFSEVYLFFDYDGHQNNLALPLRKGQSAPRPLRPSAGNARLLLRACRLARPVFKGMLPFPPSTGRAFGQLYESSLLHLRSRFLRSLPRSDQRGPREDGGNLRRVDHGAHRHQGTPYP